MKGKIICIVIALMVLSIGAIIGAERVFTTYGRFSSTLNGHPVRVTVGRAGSLYIEPMHARDLRNNWAEHEGRLIRFTGRVEYAEKSSRTKKVRRLRLEDYTTEVYPLDAPDLPKTYERGHKYEFTGFLIREEPCAEFKKDRDAINRVYAFQIRHLGEAD